MTLSAAEPQARYLELLKLVLLDMVAERLSGERLVRISVSDRPYDSHGWVVRAAKRLFLALLHRQGLRLFRAAVDPAVGTTPGPQALTLVGKAGLDNLEQCIRLIVADEVPGDLIETGVWRGGASIFACAVLNVLGDRTRKVWVADSFRGLPPPDTKRYPIDEGDIGHQLSFLSVPVKTVQHNFEQFGLLDERVCFAEGWFRDTLPTLPVERFALIRLDGDMYESTMDALTNLYPRLAPRGIVIIDDYHLQRCRAAVDDFRRAHSILEPPVLESTGLAWWRRGDSG